MEIPVRNAHGECGLNFVCVVVFDLTLFWRCQNVPLLAKGEGRLREQTG